MSHNLNHVREEAQRAKVLRDRIADMFDADEATILDTLEGETDINEAILEVVEEISTRKAEASAIDIRIKALQDRKSRLEKGVETLRAVICQAMDMTGIKQVKNEAATITLKPTPPSVSITDEEAIPAVFWKPQDPKLDKSALKQALDNGEEIPGATLSNGGITITIREK